jgi:hypothetical protein
VDAALENITFNNVRLIVDGDPESPWKKGPNALTIENVQNFSLKQVAIEWGALRPDHWRSALVVENARGLILDGVSAGPALTAPAAPAVRLKSVQGATIRNCQAQAGTGTFLRLAGAETREVVLQGNDTRLARVPVEQAAEVKSAAVRAG